jgi:hypothetical protein
MSSRSTLIFIILAIIAVYAYSYYFHPSSVGVLQTSHKFFDPVCLLEKQPVVIQDGCIDLNKTSILFKSKPIDPTSITMNAWTKNTWKYVIIHNQAAAPTTEATEVLVCPATAKRDEYGAPVNDTAIVAFKMSANQSVILPFHWSFYLPSDVSNITITGIHDIITYFLPS